jgi:copper chaperone CopZ
MKTVANGTIYITQHEGRPCRLESLKKQVSKIAGISGVETNHVTHMLSIEYDPKKVTMDEIRKKVETSQAITNF